MKAKHVSRILIVDDHLVVRMGLSALLSFEPDLEIVGETDNGLDAVKLAGEMKPDLIIMDLMLPKLNGAEAIRKIVAQMPSVKIMILTTYDTAHELKIALDAGASGAIVKTSTHEEISKTIRRILTGERVISPGIAHTLAILDAQHQLTKRQIEILELMSKGCSNDDLATILNISINSVKDHLRQIFARLEVANRAEAVSVALQQHLIGKCSQTTEQNPRKFKDAPS